MARPKKKALDYFPFDVGFFGDDKILPVAREFGIKGEIVAVKLLCAIYRNGYFYEWTERSRNKLLGELPTISDGLLSEIVGRLAKWGFFEKSLLDSAGILTSRGIQRRYFNAVSRRKLDSHLPYLLIDEKELMYAETELMHAETELMHAEIPQKKRKETKVSLYNTSPTTTACACVREEVAMMRANGSWCEQVMMRFGLSPAELTAMLDEFAGDCELRGKTVHESAGDAQSHFVSWMMRKREIESEQKRKSNGTDNQRRTSAEYIADAERRAIERSEQLIAAAKARRRGVS